jgi:hypothetical protein
LHVSEGVKALVTFEAPEFVFSQCHSRYYQILHKRVSKEKSKTYLVELVRL